MSERNYFREAVDEARSIALPAGIHENTVFVNVKTGYESDVHGTTQKKQFFVQLKKLDGKGRDLGSHTLDQFRIDVTKSYAVNSLGGLVKYSYRLLDLFYSTEELDKMFDPFATILLDKKEKAEDVADEFLIDTITGNRLKHDSKIGDVEKEIVNEAVRLLNEKKDSFKDIKVRLSLEEKVVGSNVYIQIPRYGEFIELMTVTKKDSKLYKK